MEILKEHLRKIYSLYTPYDLSVEFGGTQFTLIGCKDKETLCLRSVNSDALVTAPITDVKPFLRSLLYLDGYFNELYERGTDEEVQKYWNWDYLEILNIETKYEVSEILIEYLPYGLVQLMLKHHFNIFDLSKEDYIVKK